MSQGAGLVLAILILASSVAMMSTDLYAPTLARLPDYFGASPAAVKLTMSLNVAAYALATLIHGPLSERFGRRPVLLIGMAAFTLFSLLCGFAQSIEFLIAARVAQGFAAAVEGVVVLAIIRDIFDGRGQVRALALYGVATALSPAVAPILGAWIYIWSGWRMNFHILTAIAFIATVLIWIHLRESGTRDRGALDLRRVVRDYAGLLRNREYLRYTLIGGCTLGFFFAFITAGPFILIHGHGLPTQHFGYFQGLLVISYAAGSYLAGRLVRSRDSAAILHFGVVPVVIGGVLLLAVVFGGMETPLTLAAVLCLIAFGDGPVFATTPGLAMDATDCRPGPAAAMLLAIELGIGALAALAVGVFHDGTTRPFAITTAVLCGLVLVAGLAGRRQRGG
jgi:DHA1 family bicyclomycin/chloramphenicol resistance-like MFS transporter